MNNILKDKFSKNIAKMGLAVILNCNQRIAPKIYLPFAPHIFVDIHRFEEITNIYNMSYWYVDELDTSDHLLQKATSNIGCQEMIEYYRLSVDGKE